MRHKIGIDRGACLFGRKRSMKTSLVLAGAALAGGCALLDWMRVPVRSNFGQLVDANGMTLYTFDKDPPGRSVCNAECVVNWPPLIAAVGAKPAGGYTIIDREDGRKQWTYDGKPLYLSAKDAKPGDRAGDAFQNLWRVAKR
jgi:predicted lipoprotein with Yx(FWY)xxD motif